MDARRDISFTEELADLQATINVLRPRYLALLDSHPNPERALALLPQDQKASFAEILNLPAPGLVVRGPPGTPAPPPSLPAHPRSPGPLANKGRHNASKARPARDSKAKDTDPSTKPKAPNSREQLKMV